MTTLTAIDVIHATLTLGVALPLANGIGWRIMSAMFDREPLVTGMRS